MQLSGGLDLYTRWKANPTGLLTSRYCRWLIDYSCYRRQWQLRPLRRRLLQRNVSDSGQREGLPPLQNRKVYITYYYGTYIIYIPTYMLQACYYISLSIYIYKWAYKGCWSLRHMLRSSNVVVYLLVVIRVLSSICGPYIWYVYIPKRRVHSFGGREVKDNYYYWDNNNDYHIPLSCTLITTIPTSCFSCYYTLSCAYLERRWRWIDSGWEDGRETHLDWIGFGRGNDFGSY